LDIDGCLPSVLREILAVLLKALDEFPIFWKHEREGNRGHIEKTESTIKCEIGMYQDQNGAKRVYPADMILIWLCSLLNLRFC